MKVTVAFAVKQNCIQVDQILYLAQRRAVDHLVIQTYRHSKEVGFIHHVQNHFAHLAVIHREVVVHVVPLLVSEELHDAREGLRNHPDAIVGKAVELAGLHSFLLSLAVVLPLVLLRRLKMRNLLKIYFETCSKKSDICVHVGFKHF